MLFLSITIGAAFGLLASLTAFVITWHEYAKHELNRRRLFVEAGQAAFFAFLVFLVLAIAGGVFLTRYILE
jgi:hypothetical protein